MKARVVLSTWLILVLLSSVVVPLAIAEGPATDDTGAAQPTRRPVELTVAPGPGIEAGGWQPEAPVTFVLDDGSAENNIGVGSGGTAIQFIWLNRFTPNPADFPFELEQISVAFCYPDVPVGGAIDVMVYEDTDGDGDPSDATWLATYSGTVQNNNCSFSVYDLATPLLLSGPGDVLIGVVNRYVVSGATPQDHPAALDQTASAGRSWVGWYNADPPSPPLLPPDAVWGLIDGFGFPGNWLIRGAGETVGVQEPDIYVDPDALNETLCIDEIRTVELNVCNNGTAALDWSLSEVAPGRIMDVLWDNGPMVTHPGGGYGGAHLSALQTNLGLNTYGFGNQVYYGYRMADDFVVDTEWTVDQITFFAYQTNAPTNPSTITGVYYQIWDGSPDNPGSSVVFGDLVTNRLANSVWSNIYRATDYDPLNSARPIMADTATAGVVLPPGTYWLDWMTDGTLSSGPWAPPISILGQTTTGNALQYTGAWAPALDTGTSTQQGMPFFIEGTTGPTDIPWLSEDPTSGTVDPGECQVVEVTFDATSLTPDLYTGELLIESNDPDEPELTVPVAMTVEECGELTMHVENIAGWFFTDPMGTWILRANVLVGDQNGDPLGEVLVLATISIPGRDDAMRMRYTRPNGWARFWAPALWDGNYEICVENLTLEGYTYNPDDNVYYCMDWDWDAP